MKTRTIDLKWSIKVPAWLPKMHEIERLYKTCKFKLFPYRCIDTGVRCNYAMPEYEWRGAGLPRIMVHIFVGPLSREAVVARLQTVFETTRIQSPRSSNASLHPERLMSSACECCGKTVMTIGFGPKSFPFSIGFNWWNGFRACLECLSTAVMQGSERSGVMTLVKDQIYHINGKGALIKPTPNNPNHNIVIEKKHG